MARTDQSSNESRPGRLAATLAAGGIVAALGAASCCVIPFGLFALGISGAWIGNLTALEPYQPVFIVAAAALIGTGIFLVYRKPRVEQACAYGRCNTQRSAPLVKVALWAAVMLFVIAIAFPRIAASLL